MSIFLKGGVRYQWEPVRAINLHCLHTLSLALLQTHIFFLSPCLTVQTHTHSNHLRLTHSHTHTHTHKHTHSNHLRLTHSEKKLGILGKSLTLARVMEVKIMLKKQRKGQIGTQID